MFIRNWKKEILTIPNLLSLFRLLLIPAYVSVYLNAAEDREYLLAGTILSLSCLTDLIDGKVARKFNMISNLGKLLDPLADKLTQLALILCLSAKYAILYPVLALFLVKEIFQVVAVITNFRRGKVLPGALMEGKLCTTVLFVSLIAMVLFPNMNSILADLLILTDAVFLAVSFGSYVLAYYGKNQKLQNWE